MAAKPRTPNGRRTFRLWPVSQGIRVELEPSLAMTYEQERRLDIGLRAWAQGRGMVVQGDFPIYRIDAAAGALSAEYQVALVDWLIERPGLSAMALTLTMPPLDAGSGLPTEARLQVAIADMGLIGLTLLHRTQRISPDRYLQVLAEFETSQTTPRPQGEPDWRSASLGGAVH